jgi:glycerol kinase
MRGYCPLCHCFFSVWHYGIAGQFMTTAIGGGFLSLNKDADIPVKVMRVDGGMVANKFLMQFQADIMGIPVDVPVITETTALGAAYLAALGIGEFSSLDDLSSHWKLGQRFEPHMGQDQRESLLHDWHRAVERSKAWEEH